MPSFTKGANQIVAEDAGAQSIASWATAISKGPANESGQAVSFLVSNDNSGLFAAQPAVDPSGRLAFTSAPNASGSATVTLKIMDDGGTANSGVDTSAPQTFTINVTAVNDAPSATNNKATQSLQYSDAIQNVTISGSDIDSHPLTASASFSKDGGAAQAGLPTGMTLSSPANCTASTVQLIGTGTSCSWTVSGRAMVAPGTYAVTVKVEDSDGAFNNTTFTVTVTQEDARAYYTGGLFVNTSSATSSNATTTLSATVRDITAETGDAATDSLAGDIRNATVTFVNRDASNAPIAGCSNLPVQLVDAADTKTGTVNCIWNVSINGDSSDFTIGIVVNNYYTRNSSTDNTVVTVSKPLTTNFITGGGYLVMSDPSSSAGLYTGASGLKTNFGFNVKYSPGGKNLQGRINVIVRGKDGKVYQIKGNQMDTLAVTTVSNNPLVTAATYSGKANITNITDPLNTISLGGGHSFQMKLTDKGEPGKTDTIGITVYGNNNGALLFSSNWNGTNTIEQLLGGGNLQVR
ncbi:MAG: hypothetical protein LC768_11415 [Acidobacteria bacterium]|nr:hypothetical protein [Acidobacteriota bacterium]MCA1638919.1 hypothetical protein [Acidobacteriota bacterium]